MNTLQWVELKRFLNLTQAHIVAAKLHSEGIETQIPNSVSHSTLAHISIALGGVRLMVKGEDVERAKKLLMSFESYRNGHDKDHANNVISGQFQQLDSVRSRIRLLMVATLLASLLFVIIFYFAQKQ